MTVADNQLDKKTTAHFVDSSPLSPPPVLSRRSSLRLRPIAPIESFQERYQIDNSLLNLFWATYLIYTILILFLVEEWLLSIGSDWSYVLAAAMVPVGLAPIYIALCYLFGSRKVNGHKT